MRQETIDLIIPAYRAAWCLRDCLSTVARQTRLPNRVLIGIDACAETASLLDRIDPREYSGLRIDPYYFAAHVGPYRIRNTLAMISEADIITTFDADDLMWPAHIESLAETRDPGTVAITGGIQAEAGQPRKWSKWAHAIVCIARRDFIRGGGWEPWPCSADTEALQRWGQLGIERRQTGTATMTVRKHARSLTRGPEYGRGTQVREDYKARVRARARRPVHRTEVATAPCQPLQIKAKKSLYSQNRTAIFKTSKPEECGDATPSKREKGKGTWTSTRSLPK